MHSQFSIPTGRITRARPKDGKVEGNTDWGRKGKEREWENKNWGRGGSVVHQNLEVLKIVDSTWAWVCQDAPFVPHSWYKKKRCPCPALPYSLGSTACNFSQATARKVSVLGSAPLEGHWGVMLSACPFWMTVPLRTDSWQGTQANQLYTDHVIVWGLLEGCDSPASLCSCQESLSLTSHFSCLWGTSLSIPPHQLVEIYSCLCNMPEPSYPLTCCLHFC